jgi:mRNA-degrading endonuclease RelE of RelBE toxin-antitoxin system
MDIKKLRGYDDIFRVRKGSLRVMYRKDTKREIFVLAIERRGEDTYKHF